MKKWGLIGLGSFTLIIWSAVLFIFLTNPSAELPAENHSFAAPVSNEKQISKQKFVAHFNGRNGSDVKEEKEDTVLGEQIITSSWVEDVSEDGKLSIDTVLESLNIAPADSDNS